MVFLVELVLVYFVAGCLAEEYLRVASDYNIYLQDESDLWTSHSVDKPALANFDKNINKFDVLQDFNHFGIVDNLKPLDILPDSNPIGILPNVDSVDLFPDGSDNKYLLYNRQNSRLQKLKLNYIKFGDENSIRSAGYKYGAPLRVISHGWTNNGFSPINSIITKAFLANNDVNVIVLDYGKVAFLPYEVACLKLPSCGHHLGKFIVWLIQVTGGLLSDIHLVGHSLGAHLCGIAGHVAGGMVGRITGLDPAGPYWANNPYRLNVSAAEYVETINTDGRILGINTPLGHANFYPNKGMHPQPGCWTSICSHEVSYKLFAASVYSNDFVGYSCPSLQAANQNDCHGYTLPMGNDVPGKRGNGLFALTTGKTWPFTLPFLEKLE